jgi:hypothetical protein
VIALFAHAICHEKGLIRFSAEHSIRTLRWGLGLGAAEVSLTVHLHEVVISERI